jgi:uncharacterized membrane protein
MNRTLKLTTAISLLLNALLVGGILGHTWRGDKGPPPWHHSAQAVSASLPADKRQILEKAMHQLDTEDEGFRDQLAAARAEATKLLQAEPFDKEAYLAQMQHIHEIHGQLMQHMAKAIADTAQQFTPEERVGLADMFRAPPPPPPANGNPPPPPNDRMPPPPNGNPPPPPDDGPPPPRP